MIRKRGGALGAIGMAMILSLSACGGTEGEETAAPVQESEAEEAVAEETSVPEQEEETEEEAEEKELSTYVEENGLKFSEHPFVKSKGLALEEGLEDYIYTNMSFELRDISVGEAEQEGYKTVTIEQKARGYRWTDGESFKTYVRFPYTLVADAYTGQVLPYEKESRGEYSADIGWDGETYHISYSKESRWEDGTEWLSLGDGGYAWWCTCYDTLSITIPEDYDGLTLLLPPVQELKESSDPDEHIMDYWTDDDCFLFQVDTDREADFNRPTYVEGYGIDFIDGDTIKTNGLAIDENNHSDFIITDVNWTLNDISIEDAETEGFKKITAEQKVEGYRWSDGENYKRFVNFPAGLLADSYTGLVFPYEGFVRNDQEMEQQDVDIEWNGERYHISYTEKMEWVDGDHWEELGDGNYGWECTFYDTYTIIIPEDYGGLSLLIPYMFKMTGNYGNEDYIMAYWEDERCYLFDLDAALDTAVVKNNEESASEKTDNTVKTEEKKTESSGSKQTAQTTGEKFDPAFYAATYPDVVAILGTDVNALYNHYLAYGKKEGRMAYAGASGGEPVSGIADTTVTVTAGQPEVPAETQSSTVSGVVPINQLANYSSVKKNMTDAEFQSAYDAALGIVQPLIGKSKEDQVRGIMSALRARFDAGMSYSTSSDHYNDPYGYLVLGSASCAGSARTTGLCLNMLGYSYEHVNENQWSHQWCRVNVNGAYWICDPYGMYAGPEPSPYGHPLVY